MTLRAPLALQILESYLVKRCPEIISRIKMIDKSCIPRGIR